MTMTDKTMTMTDKTKRQPRRVEIVDLSYQPTKAEKEEEFTVPAMTLEEAARRVLAPVGVVQVPRPARRSAS